MAHTWAETQPAGNANKYWYTSSMSSDGSIIIAGASNSRLYLSTDSGTNWSEVKPAGDANKAWQTSAMSSDGSKIIAGINSTTDGRLYLSTDSGTNWSEVKPAGDANKTWYKSAMSEDGSVIIAGVSGGRLYLGTEEAGGDPPSSIINHIMHYRRLMSR